MAGGLHRRWHPTFQLRHCAATQRLDCVKGVALCVLAFAILMPPSSARGEAPPGASTPPAATTNEPAPAPSSIQKAEGAFGDYADRSAPILSAGDDNDQTLELVPGTFGVPATTASTTGTTTNSAQPEARKGEWLVAPLPNYSPTFGWGGIAHLAYLFPLDSRDTVSPPSIVGATGYYSQNNSWVAALMMKLFFDEDHYRIKGVLLRGDLNYDFSGVGTEAGTSGQSVPLQQKMTGGIFEMLYQVLPHFYVGPNYVGSKVNINAGSGGGVDAFFAIPTNEVNTTMSGLGLHAQWDTRDSQFFPRKGSLVDADISFHSPAVGDSFSYQVYTLSYNRYISLAANQVLALRGMAQFESGDVPFYALSKFGRGSDLRGYKIGQFQDDQMFAIQGEYRLEITKRIGTVAFVGVGGVMPSLNAIALNDLLPSGGVGFRYVLAEKNHVALRFDAAWGREGSQVYLTVGEAF